MKHEIAIASTVLREGPPLTQRTPSYGDIARTVKRKIRDRDHGPLGIAIPATDRLDVQRWTGPVERRDPASYQTLSVHETWLCKAPHCRRFTMDGAYKMGRCNWCNEPRSLS